MAFTEFCCRNGGSNLNAGTRSGNSTEPGTSPFATYASGSWVVSTGVFTVASGNPSADGVAVGDFASVYADGATTTGFVGRVTAVTSTTITVSLTARSGTAPTDGTNNRTLRIGGAWAGPSGSNAFPLNFVNGTMTNAAGHIVRVNLKNDQTYIVSSAITCTPSNGPVTIYGYGANYGDRNRAIFLSSGTASFSMFSGNGNSNIYDLVFDGSSFTSGFTNTITIQGFCVRCVVINPRNNGITSSFHTSRIIQCEVYGGAVGNTSANGIAFSAGGSAIGCCVHDFGGNGFFGAGSAIVQCIVDTVGNRGINASAGFISDCTIFNCASDGIVTGNQVPTYVQNTIIDSVNGWAIVGSGLTECQTFNLAVRNASSGVATGAVNQNNTIALSANPFIDSANGDFRLNTVAGGGALLRNAGIQAFLQTQPGYGGSIGYSDIGAVQAMPPSGSGIPIGRLISGGV